MQSPVEHARSAVRHAARVRRSLHRRYPANREPRLEAELASLTAAMEPLRAALLRAPSLHRTDYLPDVRAASLAVQAERRRVRRMLKRQTGGPRKPREKVRPIAVASLKGKVYWAERQADEIELNMFGTRDQPGGLRVLTRGSFDYRREAEEWLEETTNARAILSAGRRSLMRRFPNGLPPTPANQRLYARLTAVTDKLDRLHRRAKRAAAAPIKIGRAPQPPAPVEPPRKYHRWAADDVRDALAAWAAAHGRRPTARELAQDDTLPSYGTVHALLGGLEGAADAARG